jgi:two-component system sensor histidine kinase/response regulator
MGTRARELFEQANAIGGIRGKIRLATLAKITSTEADTIVETPELIERLERSLQAVRVEFGKVAGRATEELRDSTGEQVVETLRTHIGTILELISQRAVFLGDTKTTFARITEAAAAVLRVARVSVWLTDRGVTKIACVDLFERTGAKHSSGLELFARDYAPYFAALREQRTIAAHDAHSDTRTNCFSQSYLSPLGITSMLDVPIWVNQEMVGVICHEHVGPQKTWTGDDESFAYIMANLAALALERRKM